MRLFLNRVLGSALALSLALVAGAHSRQELSEGWQFRQAGEPLWRSAAVPGCVHTDLMALGEIPDPYVGRNELEVQWVGEKDWEYRSTFVVSPEQLAESHVELVLEGVDTYADVFLNGQIVQSCDNMFRTWRVDVKSKLKPGENEIVVHFSSVFKVDMPKYLSAPFKLQAWPNNDQADIWLSLYARKAGYNYGWDWGPRLITTGLWKPVYLEAWSGLRIASTYVKTQSLEGRKAARMQALVDVSSDFEGPVSLAVATEGKKLASKAVILSKGDNQVALDFVVKKPRIWWSNGLGEHPLYDFEVIVGDEKALVTTGVRTVEVRREKDEHGTSMELVLNGTPVFCKGADYIPLDNFPARVTPEWYDALVRDAQAANMNMLRVWGGGLYESDEFYKSCDSRGILVWQDMAFACGMFPDDDHFVESVKAEVRDNVCRLRNHPSLALWCGNNENEISYYGWGWRNKTPEKYRESYERSMHRLFREVIPQVVEQYDGARYYHPGSPVTGYNGIGGNEGDSHFWSVWKGGMVDEYLQPRNIARFMSEYGFQSHACRETVYGFTEPGDRHVGSAVMLAHQKAHDDTTRDPNFGDRQMVKYMRAYYNVPEDFDSFIFLSQLQQAEAVKVAIEAHRRAKPYCMGTLYWQINDCWPVASWSSIDYNGRWKALHHYARKAYAEVLVSPYAEDGKVKVKVVSDRKGEVEGILSVSVLTFDGELLRRCEQPVKLSADACEDVCEIEMTALGHENERFVYATLKEGIEQLSANVFFEKDANRYVYPKADPHLEVEASGRGCVIAVESDKLVRGLHLWSEEGETILSDDYITLVPGECTKLEVKTSLSADELRKSLKTWSLTDLL